MLFIQNFQQISIVFFGINFLNLPFSITLLLAFCAGLISSVIIQLIIKLSIPKYPQFYTSPQPPIKNNPPPTNPQPSYQYKEPPIYEDDIPEYNQEKNQFSYQKDNDNSINNNDDDFYAEEVTQKSIKIKDNLNISSQEKEEYIEDKINQRPSPQPSSEYETEKSPSPQPPSSEYETEKSSSPQPPSSEYEAKNPLPIDIPSEEISTETPDKNDSLPKNPLKEAPSPVSVKPRQAAPYSYQPKERTEIVPKSAKVRTNQATNRSPDDIYDVSYRVITPSKNSPNDDYYDEEEDWDF
ncbi:MAG: hypothetical protein IGQ45_11795 [Cyanobacterium sp. T60_A2020_053]|nr:hypothetical protein [Cyanobacterium sp. T60_A2020_053]